MNDRIRSVLLVSLLLMSTLSVAMTGTVGATADERLESCEIAEYGNGFIDDVFISWYKATHDGEKPVTDCDTVESVSGATTDEIQSEIYSDAGSYDQGSKSFNEVSATLSSKGKAAIWHAAKVEIYEAHEAGEPESVAKERARKRVNEGFSNLSKMTLNRMTTLSNSVITDAETINSTSNLYWSDVFTFEASANANSVVPINDSYTLPNGESYNYTNVDLDGRTLFHQTSSITYGPSTLEAKPVDSELSNEVYVDGRSFTDALSDYKNNASSLRTQVETLANDTYNNYDTGQINASKYLSPADIASQYSLENNEGSAYTTATAGLLGYNTSANSSVVIEYVGTGTQVEGSLFADGDAPTTDDDGNTAWITGHEYDVSSFNTTVYLAQTDGKYSEITSDFEILSMEDTSTGEAINSTSTVEYVTLNTSASTPTDLETQLADLQAAIDNRTTKTDDCGLLCYGGGSADGTIPFVLITLLAVASLGAVGVVAYVVSKN